MGISEYRKIVKQRLDALEEVDAALRMANSLMMSTWLWKAQESIRIARIEVEADLAQHERVALTRDAQQRNEAERAGAEEPASEVRTED